MLQVKLADNQITCNVDWHPTHVLMYITPVNIWQNKIAALLTGSNHRNNKICDKVTNPEILYLFKSILVNRHTCTDHILSSIRNCKIWEKKAYIVFDWYFQTFSIICVWIKTNLWVGQPRTMSRIATDAEVQTKTHVLILNKDQNN